MVSRRNFFSITLIMLVVVFMFLVPEVIKNQVNNYGQNRYEESANTKFTDKSVYTATKTDGIKSGRFVVYIGDDRDGAVGSMVSQWCLYSKRRLLSFKSLRKYQAEPKNLPEAILIDSAYLDFDKELSVLAAYAKVGVNLIFCNLPDVKDVSRNPKLRKMLGINAIIDEKIKVEGIRLMDGFLLGGLKEYILDETMEKTQQDLDLVMPWYRISGGAKMFMHGMMEDEVMEKYYMMPDEDVITKNQNLPAIIWRNKYEDAMVFAVNGDYLSTNAGIGFLSAMMTEIKDYDIYPIINAQNMVVLNFPDLAEENESEIMERYSRSLKAVYRDVIWPGLVSVAQQNSYKMTCMLMPQMEYQNEPEGDTLIYYMKLFQEQKAEAGFSGTHREDMDISEKLDEDLELLDEVVPDYSLLSLYQGNMSDEELEETLKRKEFSKVQTVFTDYDGAQKLVSYLGDGIVRQTGICDGYSHKFSENLRMMSIQTSLGYSNIQVDLKPVAFPDSDEDSWEKLSRKFAGNTRTYWRQFSKFEKTTLSESNQHIRRFLALDYQQQRKGNKLTLDISNFEEEAWFILRTHGEGIKQATGAEFTQIEESAYLITVTEPRVQLELEEEEGRYYYLEKEKQP